MAQNVGGWRGKDYIRMAGMMLNATDRVVLYDSNVRKIDEDAVDSVLIILITAYDYSFIKAEGLAKILNTLAPPTNNGVIFLAVIDDNELLYSTEVLCIHGREQCVGDLRDLAEDVNRALLYAKAY